MHHEGGDGDQAGDAAVAQDQEQGVAKLLRCAISSHKGHGHHALLQGEGAHARGVCQECRCPLPIVHLAVVRAGVPRLKDASIRRNSRPRALAV